MNAVDADFMLIHFNILINSCSTFVPENVIFGVIYSDVVDMSVFS